MAAALGAVCPPNKRFWVGAADAKVRRKIHITELSLRMDVTSGLSHYIAEMDAMLNLFLPDFFELYRALSAALMKSSLSDWHVLGS